MTLQMNAVKSVCCYRKQIILLDKMNQSVDFESVFSLEVIVVSGGVSGVGGAGNPSLSVIKADGFECNVDLGDVPQDYGEEGRLGSVMNSWDENLIVCGGYSGSGPPFSSFKDCQNFNLKNR